LRVQLALSDKLLFSTNLNVGSTKSISTPVATSNLAAYSVYPETLRHTHYRLRHLVIIGENSHYYQSY